MSNLKLLTKMVAIRYAAVMDDESVTRMLEAVSKSIQGRIPDVTDVFVEGTELALIQVIPDEDVNLRFKVYFRGSKMRVRVTLEEGMDGHKVFDGDVPAQSTTFLIDLILDQIQDVTPEKELSDWLTEFGKEFLKKEYLEGSWVLNFPYDKEGTLMILPKGGWGKGYSFTLTVKHQRGDKEAVTVIATCPAWPSPKSKAKVVSSMADVGKFFLKTASELFNMLPEEA